MGGYDFEFIIPLRRDDLLSAQSADQYYVSEVYYGRDLETKLKECETSVKEDGCDFILEHFPTLFSVLQNFHSFDFKVLQSFYSKIIVEGLTLVNNTLILLFGDEELHSELRIKMLNVTKMSIYVAVEFLKSFQEKIDKTYSLVIDKKGKKNSKLMKLKEDHNWDWEENERIILNLIFKTIKLPLNLLWDPPVVEKEFVRIIEDCCFSVLEKPSITAIKMKPTRELINEVLGILITRYNNAISCKVKIVQMLKLYDHLASILAQAVVFFVEQYNCRSLIKELIIEIIETGSEMDTYAQESSSSREFSSFIVEIATQKPELILPCINLLLHNLNCDPYSMRICVLTVMSEIIIHALHLNEENESEEDNLPEDRRKTRDSFLEHLLDHITDVNVYVRSRVLKLWQEMYKRRVVPKRYVLSLLDQAVQRLNDKSSNVVKYAIQLISTMLENNLYGPVLDEECVKQNLKALKSKIIEAESASENPSAFKVWYCIRSEVAEFIAERCKVVERENDAESESESEADESSEETENDDAERAEMAKSFSALRKYVIERNFQILYSSLVSFEEKYFKKAKKFKNAADLVQYYQWILGNMCKDDESVLLLFKTIISSDQAEMKNAMNQAETLDKSDEEFGSDRSVLTYCEDFLKFVKAMQTASSIISRLMMGNSVVEVLEAVEYFKVVQSFQLSGAEEGMRNMLLLIDSKEASVKEAVNEAFKTLFLMTDEPDDSEKCIFAVEKLIALLKKVTLEQKKAMKNLIVHWVKSDIIGNDFLLVLWDKYSKKSSNTSNEDSRAAAVLITMYASAKPEIIKSNIDMLIKFGLDQENRKDYAFLQFTCEMFRVLYGLKNENGILMKYSPDSELVQRSVKVLDQQFFNLDNNLYPATAMELISTIYQLSEYPDAICAGFIKNILQKMKSRADNANDSLKEEYLVRFLIIAGHVIFCEWQYLENDVLCELVRKNVKSKSKENKLKDKSRKSNKKSSVSVNTSKKQNVTENPVVEDFEDDSMAVVNERVAESIRMVCENEILNEEMLLGKIGSFIVKICQNLGKYRGTLVASAASIALSKMMLVSSEFCNQYIQLYVTILEKTEDSRVKMNLILAFGDLTFRFPNTVEPWTSYFYHRLKDDSSDVRFTALLVISHLITNEMVKVKGQMSDVALCIVDSDPKIKRQAHYLFYELSSKGNSLYNVMPDIISRLSHPDHRTSEENFQTVLKMLMNLIGKDRQLEALVEKLCHRLRGASDERHCTDLSYCLTLVPYTDRTIQKLVDNIACFADKLNYAKLHKHFANIIIACKKQTKMNKMAEIASELEAKIDIILTKGVDNLDADFLKPPKTPMKTPKTPRISKSSIASTRKLKLRTSKRRNLHFSDESGSASE